MEGLHYVFVVVLVHLITGSIGTECPPDGQHFFPHPYRCSQFVECQGGVSRDVDCIDGLHFSPELGWCDFPENVGCIDSTPAPPTTEDPNVGGPVGECQPLNGAYVEFLTDSKYCNVFYKCDWGSPVRKVCPDTLHFNPAINVCDWPWNVDCTGENSGGEDSNNSSEGGSGEGIPDEDDNGNEGGDSADEDDTSGEDEEGSGEIEESVPEDNEDKGGEDDNIPNEEDVSGGSSEDNTGNNGEGICPSNGQYWLPHPYNCDQFIECNSGNYIVADCMDGFHFNPELGWCDFPENVGCINSTPAPPTTTAAPNTGGPVGECAPLNGQYVQFLTDSLHCDVFYKCDWGRPIEKSCPSGLHFNPTINVCDWPDNAGCTAGQW